MILYNRRVSVFRNIGGSSAVSTDDIVQRFKMLFQKDEQLAEEMLKMEFFKKGFEQKLLEKDFEKKLELLQKEVIFLMLL